MLPLNALRALCAVPAFIGLVVALPGTIRDGMAQGQPVCLPVPSLRCVTDQAVAAVERALRDEATKKWIGRSQLEPLAAAQRKLGDELGLARTVMLVRGMEARHGDSVGLAEFLVRFQPGDEGRLMLQRALKEVDQDLVRYAKERGTPRAILSMYAPVLAEAGLRAAAAAFLARGRELFDPVAPEMKPGDRVAYLTEIMSAYAAIGDSAEADAAAERAFAAVQALGGPAQEKIDARIRLAGEMLAAGLVEKARPVVADAHRLGAGEPVPRLNYRIAQASGDARGKAAALDAMREFRRKAMSYTFDFVRNEAQWHFYTVLAAGDRDVARAIYGEARAAVWPRNIWDIGRGGFVPMAEMAAALGDESEVQAVLEKLGPIEKRGETEAAYRRTMRFHLAELCRIFAKHGHVEAALRCAARVSEGETDTVAVELARIYIDVAAAMARR